MMIPPLKILLLGYGKMGKEIEAVALEKGHLIIGIIDNKDDWDAVDLAAVDVAIDFSIPDVVLEHIQKCIDLNISLVVGTTGWYDHMAKVGEEVRKKNAALLWASNFSIGVNILFHLNEKLASIMSENKGYQAHIHEIHHTQKLDAPSGTAISLAKGILSNTETYQGWQLLEKDQTHQKTQLPITYERMGNVKGTHIISFENDIDILSIKHEAKSRKGFANGAVLAAEWLVGKQGFFNMKDVLGF